MNAGFYYNLCIYLNVTVQLMHNQTHFNSMQYLPIASFRFVFVVLLLFFLFVLAPPYIAVLNV